MKDNDKDDSKPTYSIFMEKIILNYLLKEEHEDLLHQKVF